MSDVDAHHLLSMTTDIVVAHIEHGGLLAHETPDLIRDTYRALSALAGIADLEPQPVEQKPLEPAVPIAESVQPDYIVCLEDGKKLKMLKRYLKTAYGLTPEAYRARWGLPEDYPMTAPNYAARRSYLAKENGLGKARIAAE